MKVRFYSICNYVLVLLVLISCQTKQNQNLEKNEYQIISYLLYKYTKSSKVIPPMPIPMGGNKFNTQDSLIYYKDAYEAFSKNKLIGISPNMFPLILEEVKFKSTDCNKEGLSLLEKEEVLIEKKIDLDKIKLFNRDSITSREKDNNYDLWVSFSKIAFNEELNKALLIVSVSQGHLNGFSVLVYLEKEHYHWEVKCEEVLSIS